MRNHPLSALCAATLFTISALGAGAQAAKPGAAKSPHAAMQPIKASKPASAGLDTVVGSVGATKFTLRQVLQEIQRQNPPVYQSVVAQATASMGSRAGDMLLSNSGKTTLTITRDQIVTAVLKTPSQPLNSKLQEMLTKQAVADAAQKADLLVTPQMVSAKIATIFKQLRDAKTIPANQTDAEFLQSRNMTRAALQQNVRFSLEIQELTRFDLIKRMGRPIGPEDFVQARHILIKVDPPAGSKPEDIAKADVDAKAKIEQIAADIAAKKITFEAAAMANSDDGSKEKGGDLGVFMRGQMVKEFDATAFALPVNEVSKPVRSTFGYHIIQVTRAGKDIPEAERQTALDANLANLSRVYMQTLLTSSKAVNKLPQPQMSMPGMMGGGE